MTSLTNPLRRFSEGSYRSLQICVIFACTSQFSHPTQMPLLDMEQVRVFRPTGQLIAQAAQLRRHRTKTSLLQYFLFLWEAIPRDHTIRLQAFLVPSLCPYPGVTSRLRSTDHFPRESLLLQCNLMRRDRINHGLLEYLMTMALLQSQQGIKQSDSQANNGVYHDGEPINRPTSRT